MYINIYTYDDAAAADDDDDHLQIYTNISSNNDLRRVYICMYILYVIDDATDLIIFTDIQLFNCYLILSTSSYISLSSYLSICIRLH
jgi:hypothetical protein